MREDKARGRHLQWLVPVVIVLLVAVVARLFLTRRADDIPEVYPVDGVLDITGMDLSPDCGQCKQQLGFLPQRPVYLRGFRLRRGGTACRRGRARPGTAPTASSSRPSQSGTTPSAPTPSTTAPGSLSTAWRPPASAPWRTTPPRACPGSAI